MKKRGKRLDVLDEVQPTTVFNLLDKDDISLYFQGFEHEVGLQQIDPQLLELVYEKMIEHPPSIDSSQIEKIDVLNQGRKELLTFCKNKQLVSLFQYILTIKNNSHHHHSYYGRLLVDSFPEQFFVGPKCTHYHCKTTARKIEEEYGIYRPKSEDQKQKQNDFIQQSDEDFIDDDGEGEQSESNLRDSEDKDEGEGDQQYQQQSEPTMKRRSKIQARQQKMNKKIEEKTNKFPNRKNKMSAILDSESQHQVEESEQITMKRSKTQPKSAQKKQAASDKNMKQSEEAQILKIIEQNEIETILQKFSYVQIFLYLLQYCEDKLLTILDSDDILTIIDANKRKAKRQKKKAKKLSGINLRKSKINIKTLNLQELLNECVKEQIIEEEDTLKFEYIGPIENHVIYGHKLIAKNPSKYSKEGTFNGYESSELNNLIETQYLNYQSSSQQMQEGNINQNQSGEESQIEVSDKLDDLENRLSQN